MPSSDRQRPLITYKNKDVGEGKTRFSEILRAKAHTQDIGLETAGKTRKDFDGFGAKKTKGAEVTQAQYWPGTCTYAHLNRV